MSEQTDAEIGLKWLDKIKPGQMATRLGRLVRAARAFGFVDLNQVERVIDGSKGYNTEIGVMFLIELKESVAALREALGDKEAAQ